MSLIHAPYFFDLGNDFTSWYTHGVRSAKFDDARKLCLSIIPVSGIPFIQKECNDVIIGFLHTYGIDWSSDTHKLNNHEADTRW